MLRLPTENTSDREEKIMAEWKEYTGGAYAQGGTTLIVSRGLAERTRLPRIFNRPEVVLVRCVSAE